MLQKKASHFGALDASFRDQLARFRVSAPEIRKYFRRARHGLVCASAVKVSPVSFSDLDSVYQAAKHKGKISTNAHDFMIGLSYLGVVQEV